jgi:hypothetical protein
MKTEDKPRKPKRYNDSEREFWFALSLEENKALDDLKLAWATGDPELQCKALGRLKRTMMDYFAEKYLVYQGNYPIPCYSINYEYHTKWQKGEYFSIEEEIEEIDARPRISIPIRLYED